MIDLLLNWLWETINTSYLSLLIAVISLGFSIMTYRRQRKYLTVDWDNQYFALDTRYHVQDAKDVFKSFKFSKGMYLTATIVNPCNVNMAYLDLRAFNPRTNENHMVATQVSVPYLRDDPTVLVCPFNDSLFNNYFFELPPGKHGPLPVGTCTILHILIVFNPHVDLKDGVMVSFKSTDTSLFHRNKYSDTNRKKYRTYEKLFSLEGFDEQLAKQLPVDPD